MSFTCLNAEPWMLDFAGKEINTQVCVQEKCNTLVMILHVLLSLNHFIKNSQLLTSINVFVVNAQFFRTRYSHISRTLEYDIIMTSSIFECLPL